MEIERTFGIRCQGSGIFFEGASVIRLLIVNGCAFLPSGFEGDPFDLLMFHECYLRLLICCVSSAQTLLTFWPWKTILFYEAIWFISRCKKKNRSIRTSRPWSKWSFDSHCCPVDDFFSSSSLFQILFCYLSSREYYCVVATRMTSLSTAYF